MYFIFFNKIRIDVVNLYFLMVHYYYYYYYYYYLIILFWPCGC
jgi:hypothetical protein